MYQLCGLRTAARMDTSSRGAVQEENNEGLLPFTFYMSAFLLGCAWGWHDGHHICQSGADHHHLAAFADLVVTERLVILHQSCNRKQHLQNDTAETT